MQQRNQLTAINPERQLRQLSQTATESVRAVESATRLHDIAAAGLTPRGPLRRVPQAEIERVASLAADIEQASDAGQVAERALSSAAPELHEQTRRQLDITDALSWRVDQAVDQRGDALFDQRRRNLRASQFHDDRCADFLDSTYRPDKKKRVNIDSKLINA